MFLWTAGVKRAALQMAIVPCQGAVTPTLSFLIYKPFIKDGDTMDAVKIRVCVVLVTADVLQPTQTAS